MFSVRGSSDASVFSDPVFRGSSDASVLLFQIVKDESMNMFLQHLAQDTQ